MLAALLNAPHTDQDWQRWAWDHRDSHDRIRAAIFAQKGVKLNDYQIEPMAREDFKHFLQNNSQLHDDMNGVLGLQSNNLEDADLSQQNQLLAWINQHYQEHFDAETKAGVSG